MIVTLDRTTTQEIAKKLVTLRDTGGQVATGRVLTLIVAAHATDNIEEIIEATAQASHEHPSRVLVLITSEGTGGEHVFDGEIRLGGHAGASEIIVMKMAGEVTEHCSCVVTPLLLPDTPVVVWWPGTAPTDVASSRLGSLAQRRITDCRHGRPGALYERRNHYAPGDSDISWARLTPWRGVLASTLDQPPHTAVTRAAVYGDPGDPAVDLAAGWLADRFRIPVERHGHTTGGGAPTGSGQCGSVAVTRTEIDRGDDSVIIEVIDDQTLKVTSSYDGRSSLVAIPHHGLTECLTEELRHLEPDDAYGRALRGLNRVKFIDVD